MYVQSKVKRIGRAVVYGVGVVWPKQRARLVALLLARAFIGTRIDVFGMFEGIGVDDS